MNGTADNRYHVHIDAKPPLMDLKLDQVWLYRDFILIYTKNQFVRRYKQTILGPIWLLLNPVLQSLIYTFLFGTVVGVETDGIPYMLFHLVSNGMWTFFSTVFSQCAYTFSRNEHLFGKVHFPRMTVPIAYVLMAAIEFVISLVPLILYSLYCYFKLNYVINFAGLILAPLLLLWLGSMSLGIGILVSSMTAKYRDFSVIVNLVFRLWMYATPIVYPLSQLEPGAVRTLISLNPVTPVIEIYRKMVFGVGEIYLPGILISVLFTVFVLLLGLIFFNKIEKTFMDTV